VCLQEQEVIGLLLHDGWKEEARATMVAKGQYQTSALLLAQREGARALGPHAVRTGGFSNGSRSPLQGNI
jgi:hypothetical protein